MKILFTLFSTSLAESPMKMALPRLLDILFLPSVPTSLPTVPTSARGTGHTPPSLSWSSSFASVATPQYIWLKRRATSRVSSRCGTWSSPTGTPTGRNARMSAHWPTAYSGKPNEYVSPSPFISISVLSVGLRITRLNGSSMAKRNVSSWIAGTSLCRKIVAFSGSMPMAR